MNKIFKSLSFIFLCFCSLGKLDAQEAVNPYFTEGEMPDMLQFLPSPPDTIGTVFAYDITQYMWGKTQRIDPERSFIAISDSDCTLEGLIRAFSEPFGMTISFEESPEIYRLLRDATVTCESICHLPKAYYKRKRPFVQFNEHTLMPELEESLSKTGSYPSGHSIYGWSTALLLSEINPECAEKLMARGYIYGESRIIVGAHWQSDVDAGRLAASVAYMKLHTNPDFLKQMEKARIEFIEKKNNYDSIVQVTNNQSLDSQSYNIAGYKQSNKSSKGIIIKSGKKYINK